MPPKKKPSISSSKKTSLSSTKKKTSSKRKSSTLSRKSNPVKRMSIASTASKKTVSRAKKLVLVASATDGKVVKKRVASVKVTSETQSKAKTPAQKRMRSVTKEEQEEVIISSPKKKRAYKKVVVTEVPKDFYSKLLDMPVGTVVSLGDGSTGQLGLGPKTFTKCYPGLVRTNDGAILTNIVDIVSGGMHSLCLTNKGKVYSFGCNDEGALGRISTEINECVPMLITELEDYVIVQVSAGDSHSAFLTDEGLVFATGTFRDSNGSLGLVHPKRTEQTPVHIAMPCENRIRKIVSGLDHLVCLTIGGQLITFGSADQGQLGRVSQMNSSKGGRRGIPYLLTPDFIQIMKRRTLFSDIWSGQYNTYAKALNKNEIWTCGLNNYNQIGFPCIEPKFTLTRSDALKAKEGSSIEYISGGQHHALLLNNEGEVFSIGCHNYGRLGLGVIDHHVETPTAISTLENISSISSNTTVSFAIKNGQLFGWGMGDNGQLGIGHFTDVHEPTIMKGRHVRERKVLRVSAGGQHVLVLVSQIPEDLTKN